MTKKSITRNRLLLAIPIIIISWILVANLMGAQFLRFESSGTQYYDQTENYGLELVITRPSDNGFTSSASITYSFSFSDSNSDITSWSFGVRKEGAATDDKVILESGDADQVIADSGYYTLTEGKGNYHFILEVLDGEGYNVITTMLTYGDATTTTTIPEITTTTTKDLPFFELPLLITVIGCIVLFKRRDD